MLTNANKKKWVWYAVTSVIIVSLVLVTIQIYSIEENNIKTSVIKNQIAIQEVVAKSISKNISSELESIIFELGVLANSESLQTDLGTMQSSKLVQQTFDRINTISPTAQILALDENFKVLSQVSRTHDSFVGMTVRGLPELMDAEQNVSETDPMILSIDTLLFDEPEIAVTFPIIDEKTKDFEGLLLVTFASSEFFDRHGNIYDFESQFLEVMDENHILLIHPNVENVGKDFFGEEIQQDTGHNSFVNQHVQHVLDGNLSTVIFTIDDKIGERIHSGMPVTVNEKTEFMFSVVTPTQSINNEIAEMIFFAKIQTVFLLLSTITVLLVFLAKRTQSLKKEKLTVIGHLSSNIAHDIRNPLGAIQNASVIIEKENNGKNEIISRELRRIGLSVRRISHQIEDVLNYVRTTPISLKAYSINKTLQEAIDTLVIPSNIEISLPQEDATVMFDRDKMLVVFVNIILNAIQAIGKEDGHIAISLKENKDNISLDFKNSGPNIATRDLGRIFDPLFTSKMEGTGLGLSSCKNIVEQHKGKIQAFTDPVIFSITLPK